VVSIEAGDAEATGAGAAAGLAAASDAHVLGVCEATVAAGAGAADAAAVGGAGVVGLCGDSGHCIMLVQRLGRLLISVTPSIICA
jgi:hypothetical protein